MTSLKLPEVSKNFDENKNKKDCNDRRDINWY